MTSALLLELGQDENPTLMGSWPSDSGPQMLYDGKMLSQIFWAGTLQCRIVISFAAAHQPGGQNLAA